jgi:hypothetical protein
MKPYATFILAASTAILVLSPGQSLFAGTQRTQPVDSLRDGWSVPATAEARQELWTNALLRFSQAHPDLPGAKARVLEAAVASGDINIFGDDADLEARTKLAFTLVTLRQSLSAGEFRELLTSFQGLHTWLVEKNVIADGDCNCSGTCANGFSCQSTGCFSPKGTVNYGVCS